MGEIVEKAPDLARCIAELESDIAGSACFQNWKLNERAVVEGIHLFPGKAPHEHLRLCSDSRGRVSKIETYKRGFDKPKNQYFFYLEGSDQVAESIAFDRAGYAVNWYRFAVDPSSQLLTERIGYDVDGVPFFHIRSLYDEKQRLIEEAYFNGSGAPQQRHRFHYQDDGQIACQEFFDGKNRFEGHWQLRYTPQGLLQTREWFDENRALASTTRYKWDAQSRLIAIEQYNRFGRLESSQEFELDEIGNLLEERWKDAAGNRSKTIAYELDSEPTAEVAAEKPKKKFAFGKKKNKR